MDSQWIESHAPLHVGGKLRVLLACAGSVWVFLNLGRMVAVPTDPAAPVSLLAVERPLFVLAQMTLLITAVACIGAFVVPKRMVEGGVFVAAVGLVALTFMGDTLEYLLLFVAGGTDSGRSALAGKLIQCAIVWGAVLLLAAVVSALLTRWISRGKTEERAFPLKTDVLSFLAPAEHGHWEALEGLKTLLIATLSGLLVVWAIGSADPQSRIRHGQAVFSVVAGLYVAGILGYLWTNARSSLWILLAALLVPVVGYGLTYIRPGIAGLSAVPVSLRTAYENLADLPSNAYARALPLQFVSAGVAAGLAGSWLGRRIRHQAKEQAESAKQTQSPPKTGRP